MVNASPTSSNTKNETGFEEYSNDKGEVQVIADIEDSVDVNERLFDQEPAYEKIMNAKVVIQLDEEVVAC